MHGAKVKTKTEFFNLNQKSNSTDNPFFYTSTKVTEVNSPVSEMLYGDSKTERTAL
jgi:hypothetical protein